METSCASAALVSVSRIAQELVDRMNGDLPGLRIVDPPDEFSQAVAATAKRSGGMFVDVPGKQERSDELRQKISREDRRGSGRRGGRKAFRDD